jgi:PPOX class probable F420-dependent enzyme
MARAEQLSPGAVRLLQEKQIGHLATVMPDGTPQVTPVWVDVEPDGRHVLVNTAEGRIKARNTARNNQVALSVVDSLNPYRLTIIRGKVVERRHEGADEHIDFLSKKYLGQKTYPWRNPNEQRVILRIKPHHVIEQGVEHASGTGQTEPAPRKEREHAPADD